MRASEELYSGRVQLECVIYPGMFSTERKVVVPVGHDSHVTYAATKLLTITEEPVGEGGVKGKIWVKIRRELPDGYVVALPGEAMSEQELISVPKNLVLLA